jgi:hypothetical protein
MNNLKKAVIITMALFSALSLLYMIILTVEGAVVEHQLEVNITIKYNNTEITIITENQTYKYPNTGSYQYTETINIERDINETSTENESFVYKDEFKYNKIKDWFEEYCEENRTITLKENFTNIMKQDIRDIIQEETTEATTIIIDQTNIQNSLQAQLDGCKEAKNKCEVQNVNQTGIINNKDNDIEIKENRITDLESREIGYIVGGVILLFLLLIALADIKGWTILNKTQTRRIE